MFSKALNTKKWNVPNLKKYKKNSIELFYVYDNKKMAEEELCSYKEA